MNFFGRSTRVVLTLSGGRAVWSRWCGNAQTAEFVESLPAAHGDEVGSVPHASVDDQNGISSTTRCPWVLELEAASPPLQVHLVVDSAHSEVLRVETASTPPGLGRSAMGTLIQERRLIQRLRQNHPDATVCLAQGTSAPGAAWLNRELWPEHWILWLQSMQSGGVLFTRVTSSLQLLTSCVGDATGDAAGDVAFVLVGSHRQQHALVREGVVIFRRVVAVDGEDSVRTALTDSLNHLQSRLSVTSLSLCSSGMSEAFRQEWMKHAIVSDVVEPSLDSDEMPFADESDEVPERDSQIARLLARRFVNAPQSRDARPAAGPAHEMLRALVARSQTSRLRKATAFSVLIASVTVAFAIVEGLSSVRQDARLQQEQMRLTQQISELDSAALSIHAQADTAAQLLLHIETLEQTRQRATPALMNLLADVLANYPAIGLDTMRWRADVADLEHKEPLLVSTDDPRRHVSDPRTEAGTSLVLEFSGKVDESRSLRERQERFDAFVASLTELEAVARVEVLLSPLAQAAANSRRAVASEEPDYQVRVNLHDS